MSFNNLNNAVNIIRQASEEGVLIFIENGKVKVKADKNKQLNPALLEEIRKNKEDIAIIIGSISSQGQKISKPTSSAPRIPLSYNQEGLWFIDQLEGSVQYHVPAVLRLTGDLDIPGLESSLGEIVNRHEVLRSVILEEEGQAYQQVLAPDGWSL
ncbi:MAG: condensation domain-containing protein, partial [Cyclobacteriaceae bacterium]